MLFFYYVSCNLISSSSSSMSYYISNHKPFFTSIRNVWAPWQSTSLIHWGFTLYLIHAFKLPILLLYFQLVFSSSVGGFQSCTNCQSRLRLRWIQCWNVGFHFICPSDFAIVDSINYGNCGHIWTINRLQAECYCLWMHRRLRNIYVGCSRWWVGCKLLVLLVIKGINFGCHVSDSRPSGLETKI